MWRCPNSDRAAVTRGETIELDEHPVAPAVARAAGAVYAQHVAQDAALTAHTATWHADLFDEIVREIRAQVAQQANEARAAAAGIPTVPIHRAALRADRRAIRSGEQVRIGTLIYGYTSQGELFIGRLVAQHPDRVAVEYLTAADTLDAVPTWQADARRGTILTLALPTLLEQAAQVPATRAP